MALHGDVRVNGDPIIRWTARRLTDMVAFEAEHEYAVEVVYVEQHVLVDARIWHRFSDGAAVLTQKVMQAAVAGAPASMASA